MTRKPTYEELEKRVKALRLGNIKHKELEEALQHERAQLLSVFDSIDEAIYIIDTDTYEILYVNQAQKNAFQKELLGRICYREFHGLDSPCEHCNNEIILRQKYAPYQHEYYNAILDKTYAAIDRIIRWPDGRDVRFELAIDITERKRSEEEKLALERKIQQAQKLESLSVLAGGVAHDFNNLLMGVMGNAELALLRMSPEAPGRKNVYNIKTAAEQAADLGRQMLAYSGKGRFIVKRMELQFLVEEMVHLLEASISKTVVIRYDFAKDVPPVEADPTQMRQIIMNLVINASEAIGERSGVISIRTGAMICDQNYLDETYLDKDLPEGIYSYFEITDTGSGMDRETAAKIFDPFFTTKFTGRGLGLAAVLGIVRGHKGAIKVYSEPGKGTTFKVLFPAQKGPVSSVDPQSDFESDLRLKGKTALLVDDEETVRAVGKDMLEELHMETVTAEDGREALALFKETPDKFDIIILDLTMPHMDGDATFKEMRRIRKDILVILSSGYNEQDLINRFVGRGFAGFIQKPYKIDELKEMLLIAIEDKKPS